MSGAAAGGRRLHPATLVTRTIHMIPQAVGGTAVYGWAIAKAELRQVLLFALLGAVFAAAAAALGWWRFRYMVQEREIVIEKGVFQRQRRVIPYDRVQDIGIEQPLLSRLFGIARVRIETGGSAADEGNLDSVSLSDAHQLRDVIRSWRARAEPQTEGAVAAETCAEPLLFAMPVGQLLFSGLFNFSLLFLAGIFAVLQYLDDFGIVDWEKWISPKGARSAAGLLSLTQAALLVAILLLLGMVTGVLRTIARDFRFRLTRTESGLRRRRGLFTLSEVVIPLRRVQVATIDSGLVAGRLGWHGLSFQTLGADPKEGGQQSVAPFARMEQILPILKEPDMPEPPGPAQWTRVPTRALVRWMGPTLLLALAAATAGLLDARALIAATALVVVAGIDLLRWRRHRFALDRGAFFVSHGFLARRLWIVPFERAQTISVSQGPLQRLLGLSSVLVDTAGASPLRAPQVIDLDTDAARALAARLLEEFRAGRRARPIGNAAA